MKHVPEKLEVSTVEADGRTIITLSASGCSCGVGHLTALFESTSLSPQLIRYDQQAAAEMVRRWNAVQPQS